MMNFETQEAEKQIIETYFAGDAELYFRSKTEREKRQRLEAEKAEIAERIEREKIKAEKLARIRAEETFKAQAREKFFSVNPNADEKDFNACYPQIRQQAMIDSMNPASDDSLNSSEWFEEFN